jgi:16S rRNA (guanine527-N7)-methyltransferase
VSLAPLSPEAFAETANVSRETLDKLRIYASLLQKWQERINLVGPSTLGDLWRRHFLDSAQLVPFIGHTVADLGSGAGFPGLVLAILTGKPVVLVESDQRKAAFLREVARLTGASATVQAVRIEQAKGLAADTVTARALAPLDKLAVWAAPILAAAAGTETRCVFLKGQNVEEELQTLSKMWDFDVESVPSATDTAGQILVIRNLRRRG